MSEKSVCRTQGNRIKQKITSDVPMNNGCYFRIRVLTLYLLLIDVCSSSKALGAIFDGMTIKYITNTLCLYICNLSIQVSSVSIR